jgi:hypothetical protein
MTVGRLAPLNVDLLGSKSPQIAALLDWMLDDPATRQVEIVATTGESGMTFDPPEALSTAVPRFEAAGMARRCTDDSGAVGRARLKSFNQLDQPSHWCARETFVLKCPCSNPHESKGSLGPEDFR